MSAGASPPSTNKPSTYHTLLRELILSSKDQALTLNQIYDQMERDHPDISVNRPGWKNTTRHCLSMQPCFQLREKPFPQPGRGGYWTVDVTAPDTYPRNRNRKKKQPRSGSLSPTSLSSSVAQPHKKPRRSSTTHGDSNAVASSSGSRDPYLTSSQDGDEVSDLGELSPFPPSALDSFDGRNGPFMDDYRSPRPDRGPPQHPSWAPLSANAVSASNPYDGRSLANMQSSSYPPYAYMANGVYPAPMPAYPYPYQPSPSYGQQPTQQPQPMFQPQPSPPGPREYGQPVPVGYPSATSYGNGPPPPQPQPHARVAHPGQPFYPSYHPPPFPTQMARHSASAPSTSQPMANGGYPHMSSATSSSSSVSPTVSNHSQPPQQQQRYPPQALYGHHLQPSIRAPTGVQQPVVGVEDSGLPTPQSSSSGGSHPLHLTSLMNAEIGGLIDGDGESEGGSGLVTPKLEGGGGRGD